ncbi:hypothetical protein ACVIHI_000491 [Bradyrhizobium sp. USDA 4524]|nr:hypothetical protein [Bradyrhizobium sp. USDA 4538]MCP1898704.1 hypothetical protein [Bradyrhizobium sp. USDA 4537]MCP1909202.1 hypothetical protein [Bradyrhizobium elkanii]MCP1987185.1 hypothetical protein [Bradyrhizobium sp. USDA 4539]
MEVADWSPRPKPGTVLAFLLIEWPLRFASRLAGRSRRRRRRADLRRTRRSERSWDQRQGNPQGCAGARRSSDGERPSGTGQTRCAPRCVRGGRGPRRRRRKWTGPDGITRRRRVHSRPKTSAGRKQGRPQVGSSPRRGTIGPAGEVHSAFGMRHLPHFVQQPGKACGCGLLRLPPKPEKSGEGAL